MPYQRVGAGSMSGWASKLVRNGRLICGQMWQQQMATYRRCQHEEEKGTMDSLGRLFSIHHFIPSGSSGSNRNVLVPRGGNPTPPSLDRVRRPEQSETKNQIRIVGSMVGRSHGGGLPLVIPSKLSSDHQCCNTVGAPSIRINEGR